MKVIYFGPITPKGEISLGGYESINRKIVNKLVELGVEVNEIANPRTKRGFLGLGRLKYILLFLKPLVLFKYMWKKNVIVHITPIDRFLLYTSAYIVLLAKLLRIPYLFDMHAGSFFYYYDRKGVIYRRTANFMIQNAAAITIEGRAYKQQILDRIHFDREIMYFPNSAVCYNDTHVIPATKKIGLFYFGRITNGKGIDIMLQLANILDDSFHLYLDGAISDGLDLNKIDKTKVTYLGRHTMKEIREIMKDMTFFIFPSRHIGEGQSNSLLEAMESGLIPVSSNQGFSEDVVSDCGVVLPVSATAEDYKKAILKLKAENLQVLSSRCQAHIRLHHNVDVVIPKLVDLYKRILSK